MTRTITLPPGGLVSIVEASNRTKLSTRTIRRYVAAGLLTGYRIGPRVIRIDIDELESMIRPIPTVTAA